MFLDADARFFTQFAGPCLSTDSVSLCQTRQVTRATVLMIDILHRVDGIYNANFNGSARLGLAGTLVS